MANRESVLTAARVGIVASMGLCPAAAMGSVSFRIIDPPPPVMSMVGNGLSGDGTTVVGFMGPGGATRAFRWSEATGTQDLGTLAASNYAVAYATNHNGTAVVGESHLNGVVRPGFRWSATGGLSELTPLAGFTASGGRAVSGDGLMAVGYSVNQATNQFRATRWTGPSVTELPPLAGDDFAQARGVNQDGSVIVGMSEGRAVRWIDGNVLSVGVLPGGTFSDALVVSADGLTIGGIADTADGGGAIFRWTIAGMVDLGKLPGTETPYITAINGDGSVIVGGCDLEPFLWTSTAGMRNLRTHLISLGVDLSGVDFLNVTGVSADGLTLSGTLTMQSNQQNHRVWIATIPAPSSLVILGLPIVLAARRRR